MSEKYVPVQWNQFKLGYNIVLVAATVLYLVLFIYVSPLLTGHSLPPDRAVHIARAFGTCAFIMLTIILCIGPLARLDRRFTALLYNRRHFGVLTFFVALYHPWPLINWYFAFSPTPKYEALLSSNTSVGNWLGFPIEYFGLFSLLCLACLALTSHDFWLRFLSPQIWKRLHFLIYACYLSVVLHLALGALQDDQVGFLTILVTISVILVSGLHIAASVVEKNRLKKAQSVEGWLKVANVDDIEEATAKIVVIEDDERAAVFRHKGVFHAISNACAHQNGPLGEGRILYNCVTCPWHGFQYRLSDGCAPPPFTEKLPTYNLKLKGRTLYLDPEANPPGTPTTPIHFPEPN